MCELTYVTEVSGKRKLFEAIVAPRTVDCHNDHSLEKSAVEVKIPVTQQQNYNAACRHGNIPEMILKRCLVNFIGTKNGRQLWKLCSL